MAVIRRTEKAAHDLFLAGLVKGTTHLAAGHEAIAVGASAGLRPDDYVFATYRGHHHAIARGATPEECLAELMSRATGVCKAKGGSMHLTKASAGMLGSYAIVGAHPPLAARAAAGAGGGAGWGGGPPLLGARPYRHFGHSRTDPATYRPREEVQEWLQRDPLDIARARLAALGVPAEDAVAADDRANQLVEAAIAAARAAPPADPSDALTDVWADGGSQWRT